jgi:hypothetical protein
MLMAGANAREDLREELVGRVRLIRTAVIARFRGQ